MPGRSLVDFLWIEFGSEVGHYDGMLYGRDFWNIVVGCWTRKMDISPMRESIGKESGAEGGSFGEMSGEELECYNGVVKRLPRGVVRIGALVS